MDTNVEHAFYVNNRHEGSYMKCKRCPRTNLYTYVIEEGRENDVLIHSTVEGESDTFSQINQNQAKAVREIQQVLASLRDYDLANVIENNVVGSTPFTSRDVRITNIIHDGNVAGMKGKTPKKARMIPNPDEIQDVLQHIVKNYSKVSLYIDVMHVNDIMFFVDVYRHIGLVQYRCIRKKNREKFLNAILLMIREYQSRGIFDVVSIGADKAFDAIDSEIKDEPYNVTLTTWVPPEI